MSDDADTWRALYLEALDRLGAAERQRQRQADECATYAKRAYAAEERAKKLDEDNARLLAALVTKEPSHG